MKHEDLKKLASDVADAISPAILRTGVSLVLVLADREGGWTYSLRGEHGMMQIAVASACGDLQNSEPDEFEPVGEIPEA